MTNLRLQIFLDPTDTDLKCQIMIKVLFFYFLLTASQSINYTFTMTRFFFHFRVCSPTPFGSDIDSIAQPLIVNWQISHFFLSLEISPLFYIHSAFYKMDLLLCLIRINYFSNLTLCCTSGHFPSAFTSLAGAPSEDFLLRLQKQM